MSNLAHATAAGLDTYVPARPFVKWAGGKRALIPTILGRVPGKVNHYYEPFVGGGALFYAMEGRFKKAFLSDYNADLITAYKAIRKDVDKVISLLKKHEKNHDERYFKQMRSEKSKTMFEAAARLVYLNKTCFNGLYRVNANNEFNVPIGSYKNPQICDAENLYRVSDALQNAELVNREFDRAEPSAGDLIYCDPPYDGTYNGYTKNGFDDAKQELLADKASEWRDLGAAVIVSNSNTPRIRELYPRGEWKIVRVNAPRAISCNGNDRKSVVELLITNV